MLEFFKIDLNISEEFYMNKLKENLANFGSDHKIVYSKQTFGEGSSLDINGKSNN